MAWRSRRSRRCSVLCSGPAPPRSRTAHPPSSGSSRTRHSAAATRRRRRGSPAPTAPPPLLPPSPLPLPLRRRCSGRGKTPMWVGGGGRLLLALLPLLLNPQRRKAGRIPGAAPAGSARAPPAPFSASLEHRGTARGQKGLSSPRPGSIRARARPFPSACVPLGGPAVLRPASGCGETGSARVRLGDAAGW
jgi:hypothetical protein